MKKILTTTMVIIMSGLLVGCGTMSRRDTGMAAGGIIGGALGHAATGGSAVGTIGGAVGGGFIGRELAR